MAIEISSQKKSKAPFILTVISIIIVFLVLVALGSYLYFYFANNSFVKKIQELDASSAQLNSTIAQEEKKILDVQKKINDYASLMSEHGNILNIFEIIEKNTIPTVWFSSFDIDIKNSTVFLTAEALTYSLVEQQINVFKKNELVKNAELTDLGASEEGQIGFSFSIVFDPSIFFLTLLEE